MNRTEALKHVGNIVLIDKGKEGKYYGQLEEVFTPPKKTWSGKVLVLGVASPPEFEKMHVLKDLKETAITVPGSKIEETDQSWQSTYDESAAAVIQKIVRMLHEQATEQRTLAEQWKEFGAHFGQITLPKSEEEKAAKDSAEEPYVYYRLRHKKGYVYLEEEINRDILELEGCPFEFDIQHQGKWVPATHVHAFTFQDNKKKQHQLRELDWVRIHKSQFEPFAILLNELEHPARDSFLRDLKAFGFTKDHITDCHNRLLYELLHAEGTTHFKGVNFITFKKPGKTLFVQHHYERVLHKDQPDYVYDRFECTTDKGKRSIATYTNAYTKGR